MPNLKNLITTLIAPLSARPQSGIYQKITVTGDGANHSFTMPIDGWVSLVGQNNNVGNEITWQLSEQQGRNTKLYFLYSEFDAP